LWITTKITSWFNKLTQHQTEVKKKNKNKIHSPIKNIKLFFLRLFSQLTKMKIEEIYSSKIDLQEKRYKELNESFENIFNIKPSFIAR
jgi:hypothetical protein